MLAKMLFPRVDDEELRELLWGFGITEQAPLDRTCAQPRESHLFHPRDKLRLVVRRNGVGHGNHAGLFWGLQPRGEPRLGPTPTRPIRGGDIWKGPPRYCGRPKCHGNSGDRQGHDNTSVVTDQTERERAEPQRAEEDHLKDGESPPTNP